MLQFTQSGFLRAFCPPALFPRAQVRLREAAPRQTGTGFQSIFISGSGNKLSMGTSLGFKYAFE